MSEPSRTPGSSRSRGGPLSTKSPLLLPVPEDNLQGTDLDDVFSLDTNYRPFSDEPRSFDSEGDSSDEEGVTDFTSESVHVEGVPRSHQRFDAKRYSTPAFSRQLLTMLIDDIALPGWVDLSVDEDVGRMTIFKVSGALTNAVFFVSCPKDEGVSPPTVLVRVYGPSSDSLLSRQLELHVLHTLSSEYSFGPHVLGTFENGRVEEYFDSKALDKNQMRDPMISCWIARRMKEMHSVNPDTMRLPDDASSQHPLRPMLGGRNSSNVSLLSTSSSSSVFSFGSSVSNSSSLAPRSRAPSIVPSNPPSRQHTGVRAGLSEVKAAVKRRTSKASLKFTHRQPTKSRDVLSVWANISSWLKEGSRVLRLVDRCPQRSSALPSNGTPPHPLSSPEALAAYRAEFDLAKFGEEVGRYRAYTSAKEKEHGRGKRIFAHNDAQYGNILIRVTSVNNPLDDLQRAMDDVGIEKPHELLIVVDFEYAALNPRGFDIANHLIEWQADYHSEASHALGGQYPTLAERRRFYRAYIGIDGGDDAEAAREVPEEEEDARVLKLEEEVQLWSPASHAMWATWALVQARDQVEARIAAWEKGEKLRKEGELPTIERGKSGEGEEGDAEFDYLLYAKGRVESFRRALQTLKI